MPTKLKSAVEIVGAYNVNNPQEADRLRREGVSEELQLNGSSNARSR